MGLSCQLWPHVLRLHVALPCPHNMYCVLPPPATSQVDPNPNNSQSQAVPQTVHVAFRVILFIPFVFPARWKFRATQRRKICMERNYFFSYSMPIQILAISAEQFLSRVVDAEPINTIPESLGQPYRQAGIDPFVTFVIDEVFLRIPNREPCHAMPSTMGLISKNILPFSERARVAAAWNLRLGNMVGTAGRARVRPTPGRLPFVKEVPLGAFVPENPIAESGPVMKGGMVWDRSGVVDLAVSTASTPYHREDLRFQKLCGLRACRECWSDFHMFFIDDLSPPSVLSTATLT
ncbi:hypothetical protein BGY98DRAFT_934674 [Russula aff. rugulosa BPL654]|nr:hypothetical protein BGY98DRAFT_934674 [Russula aff. rugulosa BPL654]